MICTARCTAKSTNQHFIIEHYATCTIMIVKFYCTLDWTAVTRNVKIPWNLEETPLQIKTSTEGSFFVELYDKVDINLLYM